MENESDSSTSSSSSSASGGYLSDGEIVCSLFKYQSSSDEKEDAYNLDHGIDIPEGKLCPEEEEEILKVLTTQSDSPYFQIYPNNVKEYLEEFQPSIVSSLRAIPDRKCCVVIAARNLRVQVDQNSRTKPTPIRVLCDFCIFSPREPFMVLTLTSERGKVTKANRHNSQLTRHILQYVNSTTDLSFSSIYGLVPFRLFESESEFLDRLKILENDARLVSFPDALTMSRDKCRLLVKSFLSLVSEKASGTLDQDR